MKKLICISLIICMMFYTSGYILFYFCRLNLIKSSRLYNLKESISTEELIVTKFFITPDDNRNEVNLTDDGEELLYYGKIYDIVYQYSRGDTLYLFAEYDEKENKLNDAFADLSFRKNNFQSGAFNINLLKYGFLLLNEFETGCICFCPVFLYSVHIKPGIVLEIFIKLKTPPPKYHIA